MKARRVSESEYQLDLWPSLVRALKLDRPVSGVMYVRTMRHQPGKISWRFIVSVEALRRLLDVAIAWNVSRISSTDYPPTTSRAVRVFIRKAKEVLGES